MAIFVVLLFLHVSLAIARADEVPTPGNATAAKHEEATFPIRSFYIYGNTKYTRSILRNLLTDLLGNGKTSADVEQARDRIERYYHENGFQTTLVSIPEQSVEGGMVFLQVVEGKVGDVTVSGNSWQSKDRILKQLPSLASGEIVSLPDIQKDFTQVVANPDLKVTPSFVPGKEMGKTDVELKVADKMPLHASLELSNRNSLNTTDLRLNAMARFDDLWNARHSFSFQYQASPQDWSQVMVFSGSYLLPAPWAADHNLVFYGVRSDSQSGFGEGFKTLGNGKIIGLRYMLPLTPIPQVKDYYHNLTLGFDYKDFTEAQTTSNHVEYLPFSMAYGSSLADSYGTTQVNAGLNLAFRGMVTKEDQFTAKRSNARGNYLVFTAGVERMQKLPAGLSLKMKADGQLSDQPLISNEQYAAGGMESVRGYYESELSGDKGLHTTMELIAPNLVKLLGYGDKVQCIPYLFHDFADLRNNSPLPGEAVHFTIQGVGGGMRGAVTSYLDYQVDGAYALKDAGSAKGGTREGDSRVMFRVKAQF